MVRDGRMPAIDADGHILERRQDIVKYLADDWQGRHDGALWPGGQPWDTELKGTLGFPGYKRDLSPPGQVAFWHNLLDRHGMETAILFPTGSGNMAKLQEPGFAAAATRAANIHFAKDYMTDRLKPVGVLPMREPREAVAELKRVAKLGLPGVEVLTDGLPVGLGDPFFDPVYKEAEKLGLAICIHGTRHWSHEWGAGKLRTFSEVHCFAFPAGLILKFTSVLCNAVPIKFPKLRMAFLEVGATWLPYYLARLDEHWEKRGDAEMPLLKKKPSDVFRDSNIAVSLEAEEPLLAETIDFVGAEHLIYASDVPHWDGEFPGNLEHLRGLNTISRADKEKILYSNSKAFFRV
jgi:predicted TIM-barrel fold metal-dependent hydrolase